MTIKPGGHDDAAQGWTGGYATQSFDTGSVWTWPASSWCWRANSHAASSGPTSACTARRARPGETWGGPSRAALNSARNVRPQDNSPQAAAARRIQGFHELDGLEFVARIDVEKDGRGDLRNVVKMAVEPDQTDYLQTAGATPSAAVAPPQPRVAAPVPQAARPTVPGKPAWAPVKGRVKCWVCKRQAGDSVTPTTDMVSAIPGATPSTGCSARAVARKRSMRCTATGCASRKARRHQGRHDRSV